MCRRVDENTYDKKAIAIKKNIRKKEIEKKRKETTIFLFIIYLTFAQR